MDDIEKSFIELCEKSGLRTEAFKGIASIDVKQDEEGIRDFAMGYAPLYFLLKCLRRLVEKPYLLGSLLRFGGYCWALLRRQEKGVHPDVVRFMRNEQLGKIRLMLNP